MLRANSVDAAAPETRPAMPAKRRRAALLAACLCSALGAVGSNLVSAETFYKWQDRNGNWVYGAAAPAGVKAIGVETRSGRNKSRPEPILQSSDASSANTERDNELKASIDKEMCSRARANLDALNSGALIQQLDEQGQPVTLSNSQMQAERNKAKAAIRQFCLGFTG